MAASGRRPPRQGKRNGAGLLVANTTRKDTKKISHHFSQLFPIDCVHVRHVLSHLQSAATLARALASLDDCSATLDTVKRVSLNMEYIIYLVAANIWSAHKKLQGA
jgi:hypothetical protein